MMGAVTSFILGIGMTVTAAYIFLAVALAPALINGGGMDPLAVHLFILYWGMLSFITPPVALGAFAAATVAGSRAMETGLQAMRLGSVIYFIPFLFVLNPALIFQGSWNEILVVILQALAGVVLIAGSMQGWILGVGNLAASRMMQWPIRAALIIGGLLLAIPGGGPVPLTNLQLSMISAVLIIPRWRWPGRPSADSRPWPDADAYRPGLPVIDPARARMPRRGTCATSSSRGSGRLNRKPCPI